MDVYGFFHGVRSKILDIYLDKNPHKIKFWEKNTLGASYSRDLITLKICRKVTIGHRFDNNH